MLRWCLWICSTSAALICLRNRCAPVKYTACELHGVRHQAAQSCLNHQVSQTTFPTSRFPAPTGKLPYKRKWRLRSNQDSGPTTSRSRFPESGILEAPQSQPPADYCIVPRNLRALGHIVQRWIGQCWHGTGCLGSQMLLMRLTVQFVVVVVRAC